MKRSVWVLLLIAYVLVVIPLSGHLQNRPVEVKLGYTVDADGLRIIAGDQRCALAELTVLKVLFYYGTLVGKWQGNVLIRPEYYNMFKTVETAIRLDPYNMDAYYFLQAAFTWEIGRAADVNRVLDYGMKYRTEDWQLPFYAGFNAAYFLHDYTKAAEYMQKAAELSGNPLFARLASRFFFEAGHSGLGIVFLDSMIQGTKDPQLKKVYEMRKEALLGVEKIHEAVKVFLARFGRMPAKIVDLVSSGVLDKIPADPYGGTFYLDEQGNARATSKFALSDKAASDKTD